MEKNGSAWVACPSKRFPGQFYYFNTQTGEKAWTWTGPALKPEEKPQPKASFKRIEFPKYLHNHAINPRKTYALQCNTNTPNVIGTGPSFTRRSRESEQQVSTTTHTNFKLAPAQFKEPLRTDRRHVCEGNASKKNIFNNIFLNVVNKLQKRRSNTDIEELSQAMKKAKISSTPLCTSEQGTSEWNTDELCVHVTKCDDDTASSTMHNPVNVKVCIDYLRNLSISENTDTYLVPDVEVKVCIDYLRNLSISENTDTWYLVPDVEVKVCINYLRNLSMSENTDTWYLVPDVEVLLDNFNFLKKFIAGDRTCSVLTPAAVLAKLQFLRNSCRTTAAGQVIQWLTTNSVFQSNKLDSCYNNDDQKIHEEIVAYCKEVNMFHVVIITKSKNLYDQAKQNDIHAYYFNALKIIKQTENLFLLDPSNTKWPTTTFANNVFNRKQKAHINLDKSNAVTQQNNEEMQITDKAVNCMTVSSEKQSDKSSSSVILQTIDNGGPVFQKLEKPVDMIRNALTRMKLFIEVRMEELTKGAIPERRKECLREQSIRLLDCAAGMFETLKIECIEHCLEQVENMHRSFIYLIEALK